ncbi:hypothetical protein LMG920_21665, partial [Xanthomonas vesicatoria]
MCVMRLLAAVLFGINGVACTMADASAQTTRPAPPSADCLDARQVAELHKADARTLAVAQHDGRLFRLQLAQD